MSKGLEKEIVKGGEERETWHDLVKLTGLTESCCILADKCSTLDN